MTSAQDFRLEDPYEVGQEFFRWEFATAVAGSILGIDPFDQPDVQAAKDRRARSSRAAASPVEPEGDLDAAALGGARRRLRLHPGVRRPGAATSRARAAGRARARTGPTLVSFGLGPRYLHSTGQLHKGGPDTGLFVQVVDDLGEELPIPGRPFGFPQLIAAQAAGDYEALKERGRRIAARR